MAAGRRRSSSAQPPVVAVAAEHGAPGDLVAPRVAEALGVPFLNRTLPAAAASDLADVLADLAGRPGDRSTRQQAADRALEVARRLAAGGMPTEAEEVAALVGLRTVAGDLMVFAGVDADEAEAAVREGTGEFRVPAPPSLPRAPFGLRR